LQANLRPAHSSDLKGSGIVVAGVLGRFTGTPDHSERTCARRIPGSAVRGASTLWTLSPLGCAHSPPAAYGHAAALYVVSGSESHSVEHSRVVTRLEVPMASPIQR